MSYTIVGYEGSHNGEALMTYGAAALQIDGRLVNAVTGSESNLSDFHDLVEQGHVTSIQTKYSMYDAPPKYILDVDTSDPHFILEDLHFDRWRPTRETKGFKYYFESYTHEGGNGHRYYTFDSHDSLAAWGEDAATYIAFYLYNWRCLGRKTGPSVDYPEINRMLHLALTLDHDNPFINAFHVMKYWSTNKYSNSSDGGNPWINLTLHAKRLVGYVIKNDEDLQLCYDFLEVLESECRVTPTSNS